MGALDNISNNITLPTDSTVSVGQSNIMVTSSRKVLNVLRDATNSPASPEIWDTKKEIAEHLHVSPRTINNWMARGIIPFRRYPGNVVRFKRRKVEAALSAYDVGVRD